MVGSIRNAGCEPAGRRALLVGAGSAIASSLLDAGVTELAVNDSDIERHDALLERLRKHHGARIVVGSADPMGFTLVVNAPPASMKPRPDVLDLNGDDRLKRWANSAREPRIVSVRVGRPRRPRSGPTLACEKRNFVALSVHALNICAVVALLQSVADKLGRISPVNQRSGPAARGGRAATVGGSACRNANG
jgi:hypothetical protein